MKKIFVTGDNHFNHARIIEYANRPFNNVEDMDEFMVDAWNTRVGYTDTVYHLGDFKLGGAKIAAEYFARLNGNIIVLAYPWHHDKRWLPKNISYYVPIPLYTSKTDTPIMLAEPIVVLETKETGLPKPIVLCHYEFDTWDRSHFGAWHFYGHSHVEFAKFGQKVNVGVDAHGFCPLDISILAGHLEGDGW